MNFVTFNQDYSHLAVGKDFPAFNTKYHRCDRVLF